MAHVHGAGAGAGARMTALTDVAVCVLNLVQHELGIGHLLRDVPVVPMQGGSVRASERATVVTALLGVLPGSRPMSVPSWFAGVVRRSTNVVC